MRENAERDSTALAAELGIEFDRAAPGLPFTIHTANWERLHHALAAAGLRVQRLHDAHSNAAAAAWSVCTSAAPTGGIADLRGCGAVWQVFPGGLEALVDAQDFNGTVDAVYTWVDANDPVWYGSYQQQLRAAARPAGDSAVNLARFASRDELRYSLRSLEMNLPWIDKIYLVTAGQRPAWLAEEHPRLNVVDHREIFSNPDQCLPTFNSHAIESQLANIPGLSEHFLYVNDDVFFGRYLHPNTFFGPVGQAKYCLTKGHFAEAEDLGLPINQAAANNRQVILEHFGRTTSRKFQHVAHPQRLDVHRRIHKDLGSRIAEIATHDFRAATDLSIPSSLAHQYAARLGMGYPTSVKYQYVDIGTDSFHLDMLRLARNSGLDMFCINEVLSAADPNRRSHVVSEFLSASFPIASSFEK
ncbi:stealth conserved region 3 domain-containing protein [Glutamicibacter sp. BSL13]